MNKNNKKKVLKGFFSFDYAAASIAITTEFYYVSSKDKYDRLAFTKSLIINSY